MSLCILCRSVFKDPTYDNATHIEGVPDTYLPVRDGCRLTLYNDAHQVLPIPPQPFLSSHTQSGSSKS